MKSFIKISLLILAVLIVTVSAENYLLNGGQKSTIHYRMVQKVKPTSETAVVRLTFVVPVDFTSVTYSQHISNAQFKFSVQPDKTAEETDQHGNKIRTYTWNQPRQAFNAEVTFEAVNEVNLKQIQSRSGFPVAGLTAQIMPYLQATEQVPADDPQFMKKSAELVKGSKTEFDAVQKILTFVIDHMHYVLTPEDFGAGYSLRSGKGNCQNYSHLAAALMRASGIPVRIVNGVTLKQPYDIAVGKQVLSLNMAQGRHSWIEVFFPDLGWVPFDPQQSEMFVSNRFIRVETGLDNDDTVNDGLVRWSRKKGSTALLSFSEEISADFVKDDIKLSATKTNFGPRKLLLFPGIETQFAKVETPRLPAPPKVKQKDVRNLIYDKPFITGNLDFPQGVNFAFIRERKTTESQGETSEELRKNFLVETAEYVTGKNQFAQVFLLNRPIYLHKVGLALHNFGGSGLLRVQLHEDNQGQPGPPAAKSKPVDLRSIKTRDGYFWVDFDFSDQQLLLTPDKYWISIAWSGSPIVNWFYSYGKPVGPLDGTRFKSPADPNWTHSVNFEFNYRITGMAGE